MTQTYDLEVTRFIRAPRDKVFAAFLDARSAIMERFAPSTPDGTAMRCVVHTLEPEVGGKLGYSMVPPGGDVDGPDAHRIDGAYVEIVEPERIVQSQQAPDGPDTRVTFLFEEAEGGTQLTIRHEGLPDPGWAEGAKMGWTSALENLALAWEAAEVEP